MSDFKMKNTAEELFKGHHEMMDIWQIDSEIDTFSLDISKKHQNLYGQFNTYFLSRTLHTSSFNKPQKNIAQFYKTLNDEELKRSIENAQNLVRSSSGYIDSIIDELKNKEAEQLDFIIGWHKKINVSFACIVLFFVGASLGAIIRKGGMGLPVVVAVLFFLLYYVVSIVYEDLVIEGVYTAVFGTWFPLMLFLPLGIFLTYKAAKDSSLFDVSNYIAPFKKLFSKLNKSSNEGSATV